MELAGRTLTVDIGRVCAQANGAALIKYGETTVLSTVVASDKPRDGVDFFPLSVEFEEKMYAVGKIPGGFNKREGKASENAILTSRVIDRPRDFSIQNIIFFHTQHSAGRNQFHHAVCQMQLQWREQRCLRSA